MKSFSIAGRWLPLVMFLSIRLSLFPLPARADGNGIVTDGSVGTGSYLHNPQPLQGQDILIPQDMGTTQGANLFQSFQFFNIAPGQNVTFGENVAGFLDNIIARVTGGSGSDIEGTLTVTPGGHANFYLINPSGVMFGSGASINVPGDVHISTADTIRFQQGVYTADAPAPLTSSLTGDPAAFGFSAASTANNSLLQINGANLSVQPGQTLDLTGQQIEIQNQPQNQASLTANDGEIRLIAYKGDGEVDLTRQNGRLALPAQTPSANNAGDVTIQNMTLEVSGDGGGSIAVWGGNETLSHSNLNANNNVSDNLNGGVEIQGLTAQMDQSNITVQSLNAGDAGTVNVNAQQTLSITGGTTITDATDDADNGGNIRLTSGNDLTMDNGYISTSTNGSGQAGDITIITTQGNVTLLNYSEVSSTSSDQGSAGAIQVNAANNVALSNGSEINSQTTYTVNAANAISILAGRNVSLASGGYILSQTWGSGRAGSINIQATNRLSVSDADSGIQSFAANASNGNASDIFINTGAGGMTVENGGVIKADAGGEGNGGAIKVIDLGSLTLSGQNSLIEASALGGSNGAGGTVNIQADGDVALSNGAGISSSTSADGSAGAISLTTNGRLILEGAGTAIGSGAALGSVGNVGQVSVSAKGDIELEQGAEITGSTFAQGHAGAVFLTTGGNLFINGQGSAQFTGIASNAEPGSQGDASDIRISVAKNLTLANGGGISSETLAQGNGGNIVINAANIHANASLISAESVQGSTGYTGNIHLDAANFLTLDNTQINTSSYGGNGGGMVLAGNLLLMQSSAITADTHAHAHGGNISLNFQGVVADGNNVILGGNRILAERPNVPGWNIIRAAAPDGVTGHIESSSPQLNLSGVLQVLGGPQFQAEELGKDACDRRMGSSLSIKGENGYGRQTIE